MADVNIIDHQAGDRRKHRNNLTAAQILYKKDGNIYIKTKNAGMISNFEALYMIEKGALMTNASLDE